MDYNKMEPVKFIEKVLHNYDMMPCLMIGAYVNSFKQNFDGTIERAYTLDNVRHIIEEYEGIERVNSGVLVIEGVGYLSAIGQNSLLKFIEESKLPIVLLSYSDQVIDTIRSRMKIVVKRWYPVKSLDFQRVSDAQKTMLEKKKDKDFRGANEVLFMAQNCPRLYGIKQSAGNPYDYNNDRMIGIMTYSSNR